MTLIFCRGATGWLSQFCFSGLARWLLTILIRFKYPVVLPLRSEYDPNLVTACKDQDEP
jgi:hypothetical protein